MRFEFATATQIIFGPGTLREVAPAAERLLPDPRQRGVLAVTGRTTERARRLVERLAESGLSCVPYAVPSEPTIAQALQGAQLAIDQHCQLVIAIGGGSVLDAGKAIAALSTNRADPLEYLEVIGAGKPLLAPPLPLIAIPTTAGTGAEVTRNAVLMSEPHRTKVSLRSPLMLPRLAVIDPELTFGLPAAITASTGLDALTQLIEAFVSTRANPMTDPLCRDGIQRAARSLRRACQHADDAAAREDMALAALFSGLALANAGLGAVHGFAAPLGGVFRAPHGAICAALLPHVMAANYAALRQRQPASPSLPKYDQTARLLLDDDSATAPDGIEWLRQTCRDLEIPTLGAYGITAEHFPQIVQQASQASSMRGNPIPLTADELSAVLERAV